MRGLIWPRPRWKGKNDEGIRLHAERSHLEHRIWGLERDVKKIMGESVTPYSPGVL